MDRRNLLRNAASLPLFLLFPKLCISDGYNNAFIDIHTHIFNAQDLPVESYVKKVMLHEYCSECSVKLNENEYQDIYRRIIGLLVNKAPTFEQEFSVLKKIENIDSNYLDEKIIQSFYYEETEVPVVDESGHTLDTIGMSGLPLSGDQYAKGLNDYVKNGLPSTKLLRRFVKKLTRFRFENVLEYQKIYSQNNDNILICPQIIDFSKWLDEEPNTSLEQQFKLAELIQTKSGVLNIHFFAPFDPARLVVENGNNYMELIEHYVMEQGFAGIKMYPPMGFLPYGNQLRGLSDFPEHLRSRNFGKNLDEALSQFYDWANEYRVPILSHASHSNSPGGSHNKFADSENWRPVLRQYPNLKVCFAHFGGDMGSFSRKLSDSKDLRILELADEYPYIFTDTSYYDEILKSDIAWQIQSNQYIDYFSEKPEILKKIIYGSDWLMLSLERNHQHYQNRITKWALSSYSEWDLSNLMLKNASSFLGLNEQMVLGRYKEYYKKNNINFEKFVNAFTEEVI